MVHLLYEEKGRLLQSDDVRVLMDIPRERLLWVDLISPDQVEQQVVENLLRVKLQSRQEAEEIETSSRFFETPDQILANTYVLVDGANGYQKEPVTFILRDNILISHRSSEQVSFLDIFKKIEFAGRLQNAHNLLLFVFENRIDADADMIENIAKDITAISKAVALDRNLQEEIILRIADLQELTMLLRENAIDKQRVLSSFLRSDTFPRDCDDRLRIILKDVQSLLAYTEFGFGRLEYLQNTFLGLVGLEQNKVIKIFTVATVIFMPPTLIASAYGMNFQFMPELTWKYGYGIAVGLMLGSSLITLAYFKGKKWL